MLDGLLGSMPLWAHLHELALSDSLLLVLLLPAARIIAVKSIVTISTSLRPILQLLSRANECAVR